ncbi:hypothetical protein LD120_00420 [Mesoplasma sp. JKS002657]|nr:hypothetical protein [Mesoplasma sp. JKS002661]MCL8216162.1 hypothetical protein [Mesoplasma sp. JKS002657]
MKINMPKTLTVGIDPAGIGTTGVVIKTFNGLYPQTRTTNITATNCVDAAELIIQFIDGVRYSMEDFILGDVIVEVPHGGAEKLPEVKATRELVGILKWHYKSRFKGHLPNHKDKKLLGELKTKEKTTSHIRDAKAIMDAHFHEDQRHLSCENYRGGDARAKNK